ncbi:hypothetical protein KY330_00620 [Candidatus Woesearchaeota archaeon]|nr:hypothetical protein [Candidatus Woesearchaeota archaeon]
MAEFQRQTAIKTTIQSITFGEYVKGEGWDPSYVIREDGLKLSRVNLIGTVISKSLPTDSQNFVMIDDTTAEISIRDFSEISKFKEINIGDLVLVIGKPRKFNQETYIALEIIRKISQGWFLVRKKELGIDTLNSEPPEETEGVEENEMENQKHLSDYDKVIDTIRRIDLGTGADIEEVIKFSKVNTCEDMIKKLLIQGEIFEISPNKVKVLE